MGDSNIEDVHFEPTVFGAVRRYRAMVLLVVLATMAVAVGLTLAQPATGVAWMGPSARVAEPTMSSPGRIRNGARSATSLVASA